MHTYPPVERSHTITTDTPAGWQEPAVLAQIGRLVSANNNHARGRQDVRPLYRTDKCARYRVCYRELYKDPKHSEPQSRIVADFWVKVRLDAGTPVLEELRQDLPRTGRACHF